MSPAVTPGHSLFAQHLADHNFPHTCRIATVGTSVNDYDENGQPILRDERTVRCRINPMNVRTIGDAGDLITVSGLKVTVPWNDTVRAEDRIFLPEPWDDYGPIIQSVTVTNNIWGEPSVREVTIL